MTLKEERANCILGLEADLDLYYFQNTLYVGICGTSDRFWFLRGIIFTFLIKHFFGVSILPQDLFYHINFLCRQK